MTNIVVCCVLCSGNSPWHDPDPVSSFACGFEKRHVPQPQTLRLAPGCEIHAQTQYWHSDASQFVLIMSVVEYYRNKGIFSRFSCICQSAWFLRIGYFYSYYLLLALNPLSCKYKRTNRQVSQTVAGILRHKALNTLSFCVHTMFLLFLTKYIKLVSALAVVLLYFFLFATYCGQTHW